VAGFARFCIQDGLSRSTAPMQLALHRELSRREARVGERRAPFGCSPPNFMWTWNPRLDQKTAKPFGFLLTSDF